MKVFELSKEYNVTNKELIDFLKSKNFKVSSHSQTLTDEMIDTVRTSFSKQPIKEEEKVETVPKKTTAKKSVPPKKVREYKPDEKIPCRSIVPWSVEMLGLDGRTPYKWSNFGDLEYVDYRDLQSWRRKPIITDSKIMIEDPDLCEMWKHDLGGIYQKFLGISYPEEFFDKSDSEFEDLLNNANDTLRDVIKYTAMDMIRNENYPSIQKIRIIDKILNTGIIDFV